MAFQGRRLTQVVRRRLSKAPQIVLLSYSVAERLRLQSRRASRLDQAVEGYQRTKAEADDSIDLEERLTNSTQVIGAD